MYWVFISWVFYEHPSIVNTLKWWILDVMNEWILFIKLLNHWFMLLLFITEDEEAPFVTNTHTVHTPPQTHTQTQTQTHTVYTHTHTHTHTYTYTHTHTHCTHCVYTLTQTHTVHTHCTLIHTIDSIHTIKCPHTDSRTHTHQHFKHTQCTHKL